MTRFIVVGHNGSRLEEGLMTLPVIYDTEQSLYLIPDQRYNLVGLAVRYTSEEVENFLLEKRWVKFDIPVPLDEKFWDGTTQPVVTIKDGKYIVCTAPEVRTEEEQEQREKEFREWWDRKKRNILGVI